MRTKDTTPVQAYLHERGDHMQPSETGNSEMHNAPNRKVEGPIMSLRTELFNGSLILPHKRRLSSAILSRTFTSLHFRAETSPSTTRP